MMTREDVRQFQPGDLYTNDPWDYTHRPNMYGHSVRAIEYELARLDLNKDEYHILEWGHGGTTAHFSKFIAGSKKTWSWMAMDNFSTRASAIAERNDLDARAGVIWREDYVDFPARLGRRFDLVLIDGHKPQECIKQVPLVAAHGGIVLVYDPGFALHSTAALYCDGDFILGSSIWRGTYDDRRACDRGA